MVTLGGSAAVAVSEPGDALFEVKDSVKSALHISANADTEVRGNATSTAVHERNEARAEARTTLEASANANASSGAADNARVQGSGSGILRVDL